MLSRVIGAVLRKTAPFITAAPHPQPIPVGVSNRHVHLSATDLEELFGAGHALHPLRKLAQPGQYAAEETVTLAGPKGCLERVRVLGPVRTKTQVEISRHDAIRIGMNPPVRESGDLAGTPGVAIIGPKGAIQLREGLILARRHIHMSPSDARIFGVKDGEVVRIAAGGDRSVIFDGVIVRVKQDFALELHLDTDEANAAGLENGAEVRMLIPFHNGAEAPGGRSAGGGGGRAPNRELLALVTEDAVRRAWRSGSGIMVRNGGLVTPLARDTAKELGVEIVFDGVK